LYLEYNKIACLISGYYVKGPLFLPEKGSGSPMVFCPRSGSELKRKITNVIPVCNMFKNWFTNTFGCCCQCWAGEHWGLVTLGNSALIVHPLTALIKPELNDLVVMYFYANFMFCWPCIPIDACNETNLMLCWSSVYSVTIPLHASGLLVAHHQEAAMYICDSWYVLNVLVDCPFGQTSWQSTESTTRTICCIYTLLPPHDGHYQPRNM
jgi:hypothetical protein